MDLVVDLGLGRFRALDADPDAVVPLAVALVAGGHTTRVREVIELDEARVLEVVAGEAGPIERWLDGAEASPIVAAVQQFYRTHGAQIRFPPAEVARLGVGAQPDLALVLDGPHAAAPTVALTAVTVVRVVDVDAALRAWTEKSKAVRRMASLLALAKQHRLIVHSAV